MCNPPFYSDSDDFKGLRSTRNLTERDEAKSINTGKNCELIFDEGGEVEFVKKIIQDSMVIGKRIK